MSVNPDYFLLPVILAYQYRTATKSQARLHRVMDDVLFRHLLMENPIGLLPEHIGFFKRSVLVDPLVRVADYLHRVLLLA